MLLEPPDYTFHLPTFEGPLDVLLRLIERNELDITAIALAQVADQYLAHVRSLEHPDPAALSAFLVLAARLLVIKSRALLPRPTAATAAGATSELDDAEALAQQLRTYQQFKQLASTFAGWQQTGRRSYGRTTPPPLPEAPPPQLVSTLDEMLHAVKRRIALLQNQPAPTITVPMPRQVTVADVAAQIKTRLQQQQWIDFQDLLSLSVERVEVVVSLWAVLELFKREAIVIEQQEIFGPILIGRGPQLATLQLPRGTQEFQ